MRALANTVFIGPWRIIWMSGWDPDYVDMDTPGHFTFENARVGSFQFGMVQGQSAGANAAHYGAAAARV